MDHIDDDSFTQPGAVPFKWEIRPGVPKPLNHQKPSSHRASPLKPPPSSPTSFHFPSPRTQSARFQSVIGQPEVVTMGCFQTRKGYGQRKNITHKLHVYKTDLETLSAWSESTRRSGSPFYNGSLAGVSDAEWAGYGLF
ncbi:uncharacterized protein LOC143536058 [Bidens hawaiensis]|uniref:uncharacterized protein LOC143536058 n=1 Tax=Bidens hawaiensis TaxID=980011 RepID=UPI00404AE82C